MHFYTHSIFHSLCISLLIFFAIFVQQNISTKTIEGTNRTHFVTNVSYLVNV